MRCLKVFQPILIGMFLLSTSTSCADPTYLAANSGGGNGGSGNTTFDICKKDFCFTLDWLVGPEYRKDSSFILSVRNSNGDLVDFGFTPHFYLYMPDHGHPGDPLTVTRLEKGLYKIEKVMFFMKGQWDLHISETQDENGSANDITLPLAHF